jgi:hypothetical protein
LYLRRNKIPKITIQIRASPPIAPPTIAPILLPVFEVVVPVAALDAEPETLGCEIVPDERADDVVIEEKDTNDVEGEADEEVVPDGEVDEAEVDGIWTVVCTNMLEVGAGRAGVVIATAKRLSVMPAVPQAI